MKHPVIIFGAGPIGLYLAIQLTMRGVKVHVFDQRAGMYTRPGHLNRSVFHHVESAFQEPFWDSKKTGHIKDLERYLYQRALNAGVVFEPLQFLRFDPGAGTKRIIVQNTAGEEQSVECDYAFDCTGEKRALIHGVNQVVSPAPFQLARVIEHLDVKHHFLAYVKMSSKDYELVSHRPKSLGESVSFDNIEMFRKFGWQEFSVPHLYGAQFGGGKACLYFECPEGLMPEQYKPWMRLVINSRTRYDARAEPQFAYLQDTNNSRKKPRYKAFVVDPLELNRQSHQGPGLPCVIAQGDAQIGFHYRLANGVEHGMKRVDEFVKQLTVDQGQLLFDAEQYERIVQPQIADHRDSLLSYDGTLKSQLNEAVYPANRVLQSHLRRNPNNPVLQQMGKEAELRYVCYSTGERLARMCSDNGRLLAPPSAAVADWMLIQLNDIEKQLQQTKEHLPLERVNDRKMNNKNLIQLAVVWKDLGTYFYRISRFMSAEQVYKKALAVYQQFDPDEYKLEKLILQSNLANALRKQGQFQEALEATTSALIVGDEISRYGSVLLAPKNMNGFFAKAREQVLTSGAAASCVM